MILTGSSALGGTLLVDGGTMQLPSGSLTLTSSGSGNEFIGNSATASLIQTGGTHALAGNLFMGYSASGSGSYNLSGNAVLAASSEYVGYSGSGVFTQTGGTNIIGTNLNLATNPGSVGVIQSFRRIAGGSERRARRGQRLVEHHQRQPDRRRGR